MSNAQVVGPGDWSSLRLYGHAFNVDGFSDEEYDWIAEHNYFFTTEKRHAFRIYGSPSSEFTSQLSSAQIKINNPTTRPLYYWNSSVVFDGLYVTIDEALTDTPEWKTDEDRWDYGYADFREFWVDVATDQINNYAHEGVFIDAVPKVAASGDTNLTNLHDMMDELPGFVIYNGFYTTVAGSMLAGLETLEHCDGVYVEAFLHFNCDTPDKGKQLLDTLLEVPANKYIVTSNVADTAWNSTDHQFGMAAHLIIANDNSFHRYAFDEYTTDNLLVWHEDFGKYIGEPRGVANVDGYVYTRTFENAFVTVDLENKTSSIEWGPTGTTTIVSDFNLALEGVARQSSTAYEASGDASKAIDGDINGAYSGGSVTHTEVEDNAYWQVTLDDTYNIGDINVYGRTDNCCVERLSNFTVLVYDESSRNFTEVVREYPNPSVTVSAGGVSGNIIRIRNNTGEALSLAEVEVFEYKSKNLALEGVARQSSTSNSGDAFRAIDGDTNGAYSGNSVTHTETEVNAYWQVTLDDTYNIGDINVYGRTDNCCVERLSNFTVLVYDESSRNFTEIVNESPNPSVTVNAGGASGNIIRIRSNTGEALSLAEVEVFEATRSAKGITSISENELELYPNPTTDYFQIDSTDILSVEIYNISGELVKSFNEFTEVYVIEGLVAGIYIVKTTSRGGRLNIDKLIKL